MATPPGYEPDAEVVQWARAEGKETGCRIELTHDPVAAVTGADAVYTDVWTSMGQEAETARRLKIFRPYPGQRGPVRACAPRCHLPALPPGAPRRGGDRRRDRIARARWSSSRRRTGCTPRKRSCCILMGQKYMAARISRHRRRRKLPDPGRGKGDRSPNRSPMRGVISRAIVAR